MDRLDRFIGVVNVDDNGYLDLRGRNHADVDLLVVERLKHLGGNARVAFHTRADDGYLGDGIVVVDGLGADGGGKLLTDLLSLCALALGYREGDILGVMSADGLENNVNVNFLGGKL